MSYWETRGASNEWYTPAYLFDAMECQFDLDVAAPFPGPLHTPCEGWFYDRSLERIWAGFIWMNPPFGGRNGLVPWLDKFFRHGNGVALTPDRTSAPWWQDAALKADSILFVSGRVRFIRPDGSLGKSPSNGTSLFASGHRAEAALMKAAANGLGVLVDNRLNTMRADA